MRDASYALFGGSGVLLGQGDFLGFGVFLLIGIVIGTWADLRAKRRAHG